MQSSCSIILTCRLTSGGLLNWGTGNMSEADLLYHMILLREQLNENIAQLITMTLGLFVGVYYFLHRAGLWMKIGVFILYLFGWYVFVGSGYFIGIHWIGIGMDMRDLVEQGAASHSTLQVAKILGSSEFIFYMIVVNGANFLLLIGSFVFLFFWKHPDYRVSKSATLDEKHDEQQEGA